MDALKGFLLIFTSENTFLENCREDDGLSLAEGRNEAISLVRANKKGLIFLWVK